MTAKFTLYMADNGRTKSTAFEVNPEVFNDPNTFENIVKEAADTIGDILKYPIIKAAYNETTVVEIA